MREYTAGRRNTGLTLKIKPGYATKLVFITEFHNR
jgi:hypothetical protein